MNGKSKFNKLVAKIYKNKKSNICLTCIFKYTLNLNAARR